MVDNVANNLMVVWSWAVWVTIGMWLARQIELLRLSGKYANKLKPLSEGTERAGF